MNMKTDIALNYESVLAGARGLTPEDPDPGGVNPGRGQAPAGVGVKKITRGQTPAGVGVK